jgi:hypothetical protein
MSAAADIDHEDKLFFDGRGATASKIFAQPSAVRLNRETARRSAAAEQAGRA